MKHVWDREIDGSIREIQVGEEDYHTGPICSICGFAFCQDCDEDGWNDKSCPGPKLTGDNSLSGPKVDISKLQFDKKDIIPFDGSTNGGFFISKEYNMQDILDGKHLGSLKKMAITTKGV